MKNFLTASAIMLVSACSMQQAPAPYVDKGDRVFTRGESQLDSKPKDEFREVPNPSLEYSGNEPIKGSTLDYIDGNEVKPKINSVRIEAPKEEKPILKTPQKAVEEKKSEEKKSEEKIVNQMSALDNIKPKPKPKIKEIVKKEEKEEKAEKPTKHEDVATSEEEKSPVEEIASSSKEVDVKEEGDEIIKLPTKKEELKKKVEEKVKEERPKEEKIEAVKTEEVKPEPEKPVAKVADGKFLRPIDGTVIRKFGEKNGASVNDGINIQAAEGTPVKAAGDGSVVYSGNQLQGYGNLIIIRHSNGYLTAYAHLKDLPLKKGDEVKQAEVIGHVGKTGNVDQPQLHFGVRKGRDPVDPQQFL